MLRRNELHFQLFGEPGGNFYGAEETVPERESDWAYLFVGKGGNNQCFSCQIWVLGSVVCRFYCLILFKEGNIKLIAVDNEQWRGECMADDSFGQAESSESISKLDKAIVSVCEWDFVAVRLRVGRWLDIVDRGEDIWVQGKERDAQTRLRIIESVIRVEQPIKLRQAKRPQVDVEDDLQVRDTNYDQGWKDWVALL